MNKKNMVRFTLDMNPPTKTAQQKRWTCRSGKPQPYNDPVYVANVNEYLYLLKKDKPKKPLKAPVWVEIKFTFPVKDKKRWGKRKTTRVDVDNVAKGFIDALQTTGYFKDDAHISDLYISKYWGEKGSIEVVMFEIVEG